MNKVLLLFTLLLIGVASMNAQPGHEHIHYGCHHTKNKIKPKPLTESQMQMLGQSNERSDTIDMLNYAINLDITDFGNQTIQGFCEITFSPKMDDVGQMTLDLLNLNIDSITMDGMQLDYTYDSDFIAIDFGQSFNIDDTTTVVVYYGGTPTTAEGGFGGLDFDSGIAYNLGIGLGESPYNFGRGWFPCFDNFVEWATYDLNITTSAGRIAYCNGTLLSTEDLGNDVIERRFRMSQPIPTYLVGVAVSNYETIDYIHTGQYGDIPVQLVGRPNQITAMGNTFELLDDAIDIFESWYGPYIWERVGFVLTPRGAMEHCTNIAYPIASGTGGSTFGGNRLMAHELAHHWWGNITTLSGPENMWIKEGNAEYGAHLFTEYTVGEEAFVEQVKDNNLFVLRTADNNDDGFHPLSGIPFEHTYGVHTYRKGASMLHNMRTYMGDSLFQMGQMAVLQNFQYQSIDAEMYRDHLNVVTGLDMNPFFDAWIFAPGHADYEINTVSVEPSGNNFDVFIEIQQKGRGVLNFHEDVPLTIAFYDKDYQKTEVDFMVSGEFTTVGFNLPFEPVMQIINPNQELNLAQMEQTQIVKEAGSLQSEYVNMTSFQTIEFPEGDSALVSIVHHWTGADPSNDPGIRVSPTHYWSLRGDFPDDFALSSILPYSINSFAEPLLQVTDDSLTIVYRPTPDAEWEKYPHVERIGGGNTGFMRLEPMLLGDYAFANTDFAVSTSEVAAIKNLKVFPNPTVDYLAIEGNIDMQTDIDMQIVDMSGRLVTAEKLKTDAGFFNIQIETTDWAAGQYQVVLMNENGELLSTEQIVVGN